MNLPPVDQKDRDLAVTTFDQNIVVTAGAGTGKTTLLINRLIHLLMREPAPIEMTQIVALTFTKKSANEMKVRLRERLVDLMTAEAEADSEQMADLIRRYGLNQHDIRKRASDAIRQIERSEIGTIHHFATALLRFYPIEAGVDPHFRVDEGGEHFKRLFDQMWRDWLETALGPDSPRKDLWETALAQLSLFEIESLAKTLITGSVPFDALLKKEVGNPLPNPIQAWLHSLKKETSVLIARHPEQRKIEKVLAASESLFQYVLQNGRINTTQLKTEQALIASGKPSKVKGWEADEFKTAQTLINIVKQLLQVDHALIHQLLELLAPFVKIMIDETYRQGRVSFDDLLVKARNLLRDHPAIRETLKNRYRAILIDEFQDTDPVQYEILLYLAEEPRHDSKVHNKNWRDVTLASGKLFVVGDPKQSIYGFRRADIEACHTVQEMILGQGGIHCALTTNFRSHTKILDVVNGVCSKLICQKKGLQPDYIPLHAADCDRSILDAGEASLPFRQVSLRWVENDQETRNAEQNRQLEGEAIAQWLSETVIGKTKILDHDGTPRTVQKCDIAILMRSLTGVHHLLAPLRRCGIKYLVEGERHFYRSQPVIDGVNLLRTVADPNDRLALVGLLRSPVGGLTDTEIYDLHQTDLLNYRLWSKRGLALPPIVRMLYERLDRLHEEVFNLPLETAVSRIFEQIPITLLASAAIDGEQAIANLEKIQRQAAQLGKEGQMTLREVIATLEQRVSDDPQEKESPLAEEGIDAIQIMSIHKSKGLEFPVVILAGCQTGKGQNNSAQAAKLRHDWSSGLNGLKVGAFQNLASVYLEEKVRQRETEEEKRIVYVAMTRAREHLMISAAPKERASAGSILFHLQAAIGAAAFKEMTEIASEKIPVGEGFISKTVVTEARSAPPSSLDTALDQFQSNPLLFETDIDGYTKKWTKRFQYCEEALKRPLILSPSSLKRLEEGSESKPSQSREGTSGNIASHIGKLAHRFLEKWDFKTDIGTFRDVLSSFLETQNIGKDPAEQKKIYREMESIFKIFFDSEPYETLCHSRIIGREIPFMISWKGQVMNGVIDLLYEKSGGLYIADYKTDRIQKKGLSEVVKRYRHQLQIYPQAVSRTLNREVAAMHIIFLRLGISHVQKF